MAKTQPEQSYPVIFQMEKMGWFGEYIRSAIRTSQVVAHSAKVELTSESVPEKKTALQDWGWRLKFLVVDADYVANIDLTVVCNRGDDIFSLTRKISIKEQEDRNNDNLGRLVHDYINHFASELRRVLETSS